MNETAPIRRGDAIARTLPALGLLALALLALAWGDFLPGGFRLRQLVEPDGAREARQRARHAAERMHDFALENARAEPGSIVFIGSSTIERFPLDASFPGKPCLNRGIASESARELAERVAERLPHARLDGVVVYTGALDWREEGQRAGLVALRVGQVLDRLVERAPGVPIALIGILPERNMEPAEVDRLSETNDALSALCRARGFAFVSTIGTPITSRGGSLSEESSEDDFHLDAEGYRDLARCILEEGGEVGRRLAP